MLLHPGLRTACRYSFRPRFARAVNVALTLPTILRDKNDQFPRRRTNKHELKMQEAEGLLKNQVILRVLT